MYYLTLKFENACLKMDETSKKAGHCSLQNIKGTNWSCPVGLDQVSNMLHVMFGFPPKATYRDTIFKRNEEIYEIAKKSFLRYYDYSKEDIESLGYFKNLEFFQTAKPDYNSHQKVSTMIDGQEITGNYTWNYFERRFRGKKELLDMIMGFFNDVLGVDNVKHHYYFPKFVEEFHKHLGEEKVKAFFENELKKGGKFFGVGKPLNTPIVNLLKNEYDKNNGGNSSYNQPTPLLYCKGTGRKFSFNGEIIVPLENEEYVEHLEKYGTLPTLLDGGLVTVVSIRKKPPYIGFENDFISLSDAKK